MVQEIIQFNYILEYINAKSNNCILRMTMRILDYRLKVYSLKTYKKCALNQILTVKMSCETNVRMFGQCVTIFYKLIIGTFVY